MTIKQFDDELDTLLHNFWNASIRVIQWTYDFHDYAGGNETNFNLALTNVEYEQRQRLEYRNTILDLFPADKQDEANELLRLYWKASLKEVHWLFVEEHLIEKGGTWEGIETEIQQERFKQRNYKYKLGELYKESIE